MYATIYVEKDEKFLELCFCSLGDAMRFRQFAWIFMVECPPAKTGGYGYRLKGNDILQTPSVPEGAVTDLDDETCHSMLVEILAARLVDDELEKFTSVEVGRFDGAISFRRGQLPPRRHPTNGDRIRIADPGSLVQPGMTEYGYVYTDHGSVLTVYPAEPGEESYPISGVKFFRVPTKAVVKVSNRLIARRCASRRTPPVA